MCGIIGFCDTGQAAPVIVEALRRLGYRGYDSAGIDYSRRWAITGEKGWLITKVSRWFDNAFSRLWRTSRSLQADRK